MGSDIRKATVWTETGQQFTVEDEGGKGTPTLQDVDHIRCQIPDRLQSKINLIYFRDRQPSVYCNPVPTDPKSKKAGACYFSPVMPNCDRFSNAAKKNLPKEPQREKPKKDPFAFLPTLPIRVEADLPTLNPALGVATGKRYVGLVLKERPPGESIADSKGVLKEILRLTGCKINGTFFIKDAQGKVLHTGMLVLDCGKQENHEKINQAIKALRAHPAVAAATHGLALAQGASIQVKEGE